MLLLPPKTSEYRKEKEFLNTSKREQGRECTKDAFHGYTKTLWKHVSQFSLAEFELSLGDFKLCG